MMRKISVLGGLRVTQEGPKELKAKKGKTALESSRGERDCGENKNEWPILLKNN